MMKKKTIGFAIFAFSLAGVAAWFTPWVQVRVAGRGLTDPQSEVRTGATQKLLDMGDAGVWYLARSFSTANEEARSDIVGVVKRLDPSDPRVAQFAQGVMDTFPLDSAAAVSLFPILLQQATPELTAKVNQLMTDVLGRGNEAARQELAAVALTPGTAPEVVAKLLTDSAVDVRRAMLVALGNPASREAGRVEELFAAAHDPDADNRALARAALANTGLAPGDIAAGIKMVSPNAAEKLTLLFELRWGQTVVKDPGVWLKRLATDPEPAVRVAAVRVANELGIGTGGWDKTLAETDPNAQVRWLAQFFRDQPRDLRTVDFRP
jgi:HEAT repeat protein